jgi:hypothetical protein
MKRKHRAFPSEKEKFHSIWQLLVRYPQLGRLFTLWEKLSPTHRRELIAIGGALRGLQREREHKLGERLVETRRPEVQQDS